MTRRVSIPYKLTRIASFVLLVLSISCDISPPDIVILQPQAGKSYYGTLPCDLRVTDNKGVNKVEVFLDGRSVYLFTSAPYKADIEFSGYDGTTVEFKAVAQDDAGNFAEETRSVKLYQLPPPASPILSTPPNGSTISDDTPTFDWSDPTYAVGYELMVDNESSFTSPEIYETNLSSSTYTPSSGLSSDTYYWKVRAKNSAGVWGNWSPIWSFTIAGNIVVIEPTSSTVWDLGQQNVTISWDTGNLGGTVDIHLYKGSTQVRTIITGTSNDGSYTTWDLPTDLTPDTDYRVRVYQDASHYDYSEYFTIAGNIVVTEPTSSTVWDLGQQNVTISWYTGNLGGTVDIHLYKGTSQVETIATGTSNDGSHTTWDVPTSLTPDTDYRVRVHQDASHYDYSDYFTIAGNIVVTEPTSSTVWDLGQQNVTISWDTGNLGGTVDIHLYKGTSQVETIATGTSNDGSHTTWDV
ncbi:MAG: Ser-Thr-rich GPI-anchored membrane family protein, partial [Candidatus Neomarinimicrobiota bacterium]